MAKAVMRISWNRTIRLNFRWFSRYRATSKVRERRVLLPRNRQSEPNDPPKALEFPAHRRQSRLLAPDRPGGRRSARAVVGGAGSRHRQASRRGPRSADRLLGLDRTRSREVEIAAGQPQAGR